MHFPFVSNMAYNKGFFNNTPHVILSIPYSESDMIE